MSDAMASNKWRTVKEEEDEEVDEEVDADSLFTDFPFLSFFVPFLRLEGDVSAIVVEGTTISVVSFKIQDQRVVVDCWMNNEWGIRKNA